MSIDLTMTVRQAKATAQRWVMSVAGDSPGFRGAFLHGSINTLPDEVLLPPSSDVDVIVVRSDDAMPPNPGKLLYEGVLLDISYLPADQVQSPEMILGISHLAGSFRSGSVLLDPTGRLCEIQAGVSQDFAKGEWVLRRCEHARNKILTFLDSVDLTRPFHDNVTSWLFGTGVTTHVLLVAGLRNPTVRTRYVTVQKLLAEYDRLDLHEELLALLGAAHLTRSQVEHHLSAMTEAFDAASRIIRTPVFFASDITELARPIAVDGSRELIERGFHREAMFWIAATYSRCQKVFATDAPPEIQDGFTLGYVAMLSDLGIASHEDLDVRSEQVRTYLPRLWEIAESIMSANPEIED